MKAIRVVMILGLLALMGCERMTPEEYKLKHPVSDVTVVHDELRGVTCWRVYRGISCLPDWMITKDRQPIGWQP